MKFISGIIEWHWERKFNSMLFMPQNPYFPSGGTTLRQQLIYPALPDKGDSGSKMTKILLYYKWEIHTFTLQWISHNRLFSWKFSELENFFLIFLIPRLVYGKLVKCCRNAAAVGFIGKFENDNSTAAIFWIGWKRGRRLVSLSFQHWPLDFEENVAIRI